MTRSTVNVGSSVCVLLASAIATTLAEEREQTAMIGSDDYQINSCSSWVAVVAASGVTLAAVISAMVL